jgi:hypothetical protein
VSTRTEVSILLTVVVLAMWIMAMLYEAVGMPGSLGAFIFLVFFLVTLWGEGALDRRR